jgi:hypothetical protein
MNEERQAPATQRRIGQVVDVDRRSVNPDAACDQHSPQFTDEVQRRIVYRHGTFDRHRIEWDGSAEIDRCAEGRPTCPDAERGPGRTRGHAIAHAQPGAFRSKEHDGGASHDRSGRDRDPRDVLIDLQRADACRIALIQIVPHPPRAQRLIVKRVVIADDAARDGADAECFQPLCPRFEQPWSHVVVLGE